MLEITKCIAKTKRTSDHLEKALLTDLDKIAQHLLLEFDVYERGSTKMLDTTKMFQTLQKLFDLEPKVDIVKFCCAITKNGSQCTRKQQPSSFYCKIHSFKDYIDKQEQNRTTDKITILSNDQQEQVVYGDLTEQFIDGTLYCMDNQYIYDKTTKHKVGYIDGAELVLTDDPFVLNVLN